MNDEDNKYKLMSSYEADPVSQLFADIRGTDEFGRFTANAKTYTLEQFPNIFAVAEKRFYDLKARKKALLKTSGEKQEELALADKEYSDAKTKLLELETEVDTKNAERKAELRKTLKDKFKIDANTYKGLEKTDSEDNRMETLDLIELQFLLKKIRYLENFDEDKDTTIANEKQAREDVDKILEVVKGTDKDLKIHVAQLFMNFPGDNDARIKKFDEEYGEKAGWVLYTYQDIID